MTAFDAIEESFKNDRVVFYADIEMALADEFKTIMARYYELIAIKDELVKKGHSA